MTIRILLADEQALMREAVRVILESQPDLEVVAEVDDSEFALSRAEQLRPDVAIVGTGLPNLDAIEVTRALSAGGCHVVLLSAAENVTELVAAVEVGAVGYVARNSALADLIAAVRAASDDAMTIPPWLVGPLVTQLVRKRRAYDEAARQVATLTRREREVLYLLAQGADNETIGRELLISPQTARTHIQNILAKMRLHSRFEAAALVRHSGILQELVPA